MRGGLFTFESTYGRQTEFYRQIDTYIGRICGASLNKVNKDKVGVVMIRSGTRTDRREAANPSRLGPSCRCA